jgi:hypothetical protein
MFVTLAPAETATVLPEVVTTSPLLSVPVQVVVVFAWVGSGVHWAKAGSATRIATRIALDCNARAFTCRPRDNAFTISDIPLLSGDIYDEIAFTSREIMTALSWQNRDKARDHAMRVMTGSSS